ncbi:MAG: hypothetical protein AVDCRST_MAG91-445 [uncultured Sphingomonadaceae bacterium]|uniref:DUF1835 domain-containing protein n=1 Tax=uncultured Sphingomonadaceae bacterium TaxID=169976 RepID=A0A6J4SB45_9SPHN|nr:MAG: hypothetical protein AVDCRST_MAG91-445 [uncultured Sphingomonadaceae bacterium]
MTKISRRLFLASDASSGGHLKRRFAGDGARVEIIDTRLVRDPAPDVDDIAAFFAERHRLHQACPAQCGSWIPYFDLTDATGFTSIEADWPSVEHVEFWADPDPNSQLALLLFLAWIARQDLDTGKLFLVQGQTRWGEIDADIPMPPAERVAVDADRLRLARDAWSAFRSPTPERWAELLEADLSPLPRLRETVAIMLGELPDSRTGLSGAERLMLSTVASDHVTALHVQLAFVRADPQVLMYWEVGKLLDQLADPRALAIHGLACGPFDRAMHEEDFEARYHGFKNSRLTLSDLGRAFLDGREDYALRRDMDRWWGGTHLTGANCWRWDAERRMLTPPD